MRGKKKERPRGNDAYETEDPFSEDITLEQLLSRKPFKEGKDEHGHSIQVSVRVPEWFGRKVAKIMELPGSPYELRTDFYRDAVMIGSQVIALRVKRVEDWAADNKMAQIADAAHEGMRIRNRIVHLTQAMAAMVKDDDMEEAANLLEQYIYAAHDLQLDWARKRTIRDLAAERTVMEVLRHCSAEAQEIFDRELKDAKTNRSRTAAEVH